MVLRGVQTAICFYVWDSSGNPKTGDAANITVRIRKDAGTLQAATNSPVEVDATYAPGRYSITLTAAEMSAHTIDIFPKSSTSGVQCQSLTLVTDDNYTANTYTTVGEINGQTQKLQFDANNRVVALTAVNQDKSGYALSTAGIDAVWEYAETDISAGIGNKIKTNLDATVSSRAAPGNAMSLTSAERSALWNYDESNITAGIGNRIKSNLNAQVSAVKSQTDKMSFTGSNINADVKVMSVSTTVGNYAAGQSPAEQVLATPANKLATDASGRVTVGTNADKLGYSLTSGEHSNIASAVWSFVAEGTYTMLKLMRLFASALFGKVSGAQVNAPTFRDISDTKNRIAMQVDDDGNRTNVTLDGD